VIVAAAAMAARVRRRSAVAALAAAWIALAVVATAGASREIASSYWGTDDRFARRAVAWHGGPALMMVAFRDNPPPEGPTYYWTSFLRNVYWQDAIRALGALSLDGPRLDRQVVFAKYHPALVPELRARFPDRMLWIWIVDDVRGDVVVPYDGSPFAAIGRDSALPRDNFESFRIPP
jgi:hypothetical protein